MKNMKKIVLVFVLIMVVGLIITGCTEAERVSQNISKEADNFNVSRRITVINIRTDKPVFELIGNFSLSNNNNKELEITCEVGNGIYKKHFVYLNDWTMYVVEDLSGSNVSKYHYEINFLPEMIQTFEITTHD